MSVTRCVVCAFICVACVLVIVPADSAASTSLFSSATSVEMTVATATLCSLAMAAIVLPAASSVCSCVVVMPSTAAVCCMSSVRAAGPPNPATAVRTGRRRAGARAGARARCRRRRLGDDVPARDAADDEAAGNRGGGAPAADDVAARPVRWCGRWRWGRWRGHARVAAVEVVAHLCRASWSVDGSSPRDPRARWGWMSGRDVRRGPGVIDPTGWPSAAQSADGALPLCDLSL